MQNHYNLVYRDEEREMIPLCRAEGVGVIPYSPLARGFLAGTGSREDWAATLRARTDPYGARDLFRACDFDVVERVVALAGKRGLRPAQVALAWLLDQPGVSAPIVGASRIEQLEDALGSLEIELDAAERAALEDPYQPRPGPGFI